MLVFLGSWRCVERGVRRLGGGLLGCWGLWASLFGVEVVDGVWVRGCGLYFYCDGVAGCGKCWFVGGLALVYVAEKSKL